ncbi:MAG TPA: antibiotic biosynthesis monooxygenase [Propionicimonas sp.]|nr:antibiotic biosynthesis monooxygenase [Propionicimonas sp.]
MDGRPGFGGFELLQPTDGRDQWLVVTRWDSEESYHAWLASAEFRRGHGHGSGEAPSSDRPKQVGVASEI